MNKPFPLYLPFSLAGVGAALMLFLGSQAHAQQTAKVVSGCGTASYTAGSVNYVTVDTAGNACGAAGAAPSGTQNVNITGINGAAPSLTNPIFTAYAEAGDTAGTFTNATQATAITATNADGYATALVSINGTYGTATALFQASDDGGTTWYNMSCVRSDGTAVETGYTTLTNTSRQWFCPVSGNDSFRVQSSAVASGTANIRISISAPPTNSAVVSGPTGTGANQVQGTSASGASDDGTNPVKAGGTFNTSGLSLTNGQRGNLQMTPDGSLRVALDTASVFQGLTFPNFASDALVTGTVSMATTALVNLYNGTNVERGRSIIGAAAAGTGTAAVAMAPSTSINASTTAGQCTAACASLLVSGAHNLYGAGFSSTATGWLLLEDATSCAANGTITPLRAYAYPTAGVTTTISWGDIPRSVATGIALCFSTTGPYTATASTTAFIFADYK